MFNKLKPIEYNFSAYLDDLITSIIDSDLSSQVQSEYIQFIEKLKEISDRYQYEYDGLIKDIDKSYLSVLEFDINKTGRDIWKQIQVILKKTKFYEEIKNVCLVENRYYCPVCGLEMKSNSSSIESNDERSILTIDHVLPKDNFQVYIFYPHNLVPMCQKCNNKKDNKLSELIYHPYYMQASVDPLTHIEVDHSVRRKQYLLEYKIADENSLFLENNFYNVFDLNKLYREQVYKQGIWNRYIPTLNSFYNEKKQYSDAFLKKILLKEIQSNIISLQNLAIQNDYEKLLLLSLKEIEQDIDSFFNKIKPITLE